MKAQILLCKRTDQGSDSVKQQLAYISFEGSLEELKELIKRLGGKVDDNCYWFCE